jgi:hypothetical protein
MVGVVALAGGNHVAATQAETFPLELLKVAKWRLKASHARD